MPSAAQVVHENPNDLYPSSDITIEESLNYLLDWIQEDLQAITIELYDHNYTTAKEYYQYYNYSTNEYLDLLWRMNMSESVYQTIAENINFSRDELQSFILNSEKYNEYYTEYAEYVASGDNASASISSGKAQVTYEGLLESYDRLRANTTVIEKVLRDNNIDDSRYQDSLNNINAFITQLEAKQGKPGYNNTNNALQLAIDPDTVSVGSSIKVTTMLSPPEGAAPEDYIVNIYFNNIFIGNYTSDPLGVGNLVYEIPANVSSDYIYVHAEAIPANKSLPREFSNEMFLQVIDVKTQLSLDVDKNNVSYGDQVLFTGRLATEGGAPVAGKTVTLYLNDEAVEKMATQEDGSFEYLFNVTPYMSENKNTLYASYKRNPYSVYLSSNSESKVITVTAKNTTLSIENTSLSIGDMGRIKGQMLTEDGIPVVGASVLAYIDGTRAGNNTTDSTGRYNIIVWIPENSSAGTHELYTAFEPGDSRSLHGSQSENLTVEYIDAARSVTVNGLPFILFLGDSLDINGTFATGTGAPLIGRSIDVSIAGISTMPVVTDGQGNFNVSYTVSGTESMGSQQMTVTQPGENGMPSATLYTGQVTVIPYNKFIAIGGPIILIALLIIAVPVLLRSRRRSIPPEKEEATDTVEDTKKPNAVPAIKKPTVAIKPMAKPARPTAPGPFKADAARAPVVDEKPLASKQAEKKKPLSQISIDGEISSISSTIKKGDLKQALAYTYVASRKIAITHGFSVPDSMTHQEFYASIEKAYPALAQPLQFIIKPYETVTFAKQDVSSSDLNSAINGLKEFYMGLEDKEEGAD